MGWLKYRDLTQACKDSISSILTLLWKDPTDLTKKLSHDVSGVSTGTTRTVTWRDRDVDMGNVPLRATGTIASAAVRTLNATPVQMIAAPGAGFYIKVHRVHWMLDHQGADYDGAAAGEDLAVKYTNASGAEVCDAVDHSGFADASADAHSVCESKQVVPVANAAVVAHILSGEWYASAGDGILRWAAEYTIETYDLSA